MSSRHYQFRKPSPGSSSSKLIQIACERSAFSPNLCWLFIHQVVELGEMVNPMAVRALGRLLRRLSKATDVVFCGRVLSTLSRSPSLPSSFPSSLAFFSLLFLRYSHSQNRSFVRSNWSQSKRNGEWTRNRLRRIFVIPYFLFLSSLFIL